MRFNMYSLIYILILSYIRNGFADFMTKNADNYGPYYVEWEHFDKCRGPKMANLTTYTTNLSKTVNDDYIGSMNVTFHEQTRIDEIKLYVYTIKDGSKTVLWNYIVSKPCQHFMLAALVDAQLGVRNCVVKKSVYSMDLNLTKLMMNYLGDSFFYGEYFFKVLVLSKKGNIVCLMFDPKFKKKTKN